ncbi:hypothetical protein A2763_01585 [Candidatus Kaiserbacteria bacterium RIFCSPHIGHO2_01_FULL_54_36]|uniref:Uncharacterized protein n=1 Tax=Candidatus Kaiserbacteria bacterium RIFCSPHIGHO2_01_FULL_54_36 TaxID=1798482 RepID=A0A1F6CL53_9BACT|nr:MAG: hypothetical protein A2763_01585 [Candidatus Kaiserbacteria bacterium RIFCSPHIGHO2_01_FULL_54_36]OGG75469.1 MAG: hypothetical protein A3A41_01185 [Candidatus Kaiserbacteria bacterium RIFCSPLOWO2_01_FULL_54_22]
MAHVAQRYNIIGTRRLEDYLTAGIEHQNTRSIGMEVETSFLTHDNHPITIHQSQQIFDGLCDEARWEVTQKKGDLISVITDRHGNKLLYELGRQNIEVATVPASAQTVVPQCLEVLEEVYRVAKRFGAYPHFSPFIDTDDDLLVIPDERDAVWLALDGREALNPLTKISAVQFTIEVPSDKALQCLNNLGASLDRYLFDYPQDKVWRTYVQESEAGYLVDRYGGPGQFESISHYCAELAKHGVVCGSTLVPYEQVPELDIPLYLRSIWWYFRLRRYGNSLCIEIRPLPRRHDDVMQSQLELVLDTLSL